MKCGFMRQIEAREQARDRVVVQGKVLYRAPKAVKIWAPIATEWIPLSQISDPLSPSTLEPLNLGEIGEGEEVIFTIPAWLAREKGLVE